MATISTAVNWGASIPDIGRELHRRISAYLARIAGIEAETVDVVVGEIGSPV